VGFVLLVNPYPVLVVALCAWLMWSLSTGLSHALARGAVGSVSDTLGYAAFFAVSMVLAILAAGHLLVAFIEGYRGEEL